MDDLVNELGDVSSADDLANRLLEDDDLGICPTCGEEWRLEPRGDRTLVVSAYCQHRVSYDWPLKMAAKYGRAIALHVRPRFDVTEPASELAPAAAWTLASWNGNDPVLFKHGGGFVKVVDSELKPVSAVQLRVDLAAAAEWRKGEKKVDPPTSVVSMVMALDAKPDIPEVERIVTAPVLTRDGSLVSEPGYHAGSKLYYAPPVELLALEVPAVVTAEDVVAARTLLLEELLGDFPFVGPADKANAIAAMLTPFLRDCIDGATPFHMIDKPAPGTGAGLLADVLTIPTLGAEPESKQWSGREDERRKNLLGLLASGAAIAKWDNLTGTIDSAHLNSALTEAVYSDRLLGSNRIASYRVRCLWIGTANNARLGKDFKSRVVPIRLDAQVEEPRRRSGPREGQTWRYPNLRQWAKEHRADLVRACLVLCRAWIQNGMPKVTAATPLGSFEDYAAVLNGVLSTAGGRSFLTNLEMLEDEESTELAVLLRMWRATYQGAEISARELINDGRLRKELADAGASTDDPRALGTWLGSKRDRVYDGLVLRRKKREDGNRWRVVPIQSE